MKNRELQEIIDNLADYKVVNISEVDYLDPTSIMYEGNVYIIENKAISSLIGSSYGIPNRSTNNNLYKMSPELWKSYVGGIHNTSQDLSGFIALQGNQVVSFTKSSYYSIINLITNLNSKYNIDILYNDTYRLDVMINIKDSEGFMSGIGLIYYKDEDYIQLYGCIDASISGNTYNIFSSKSIYSKYMVDTSINDVIELIDSELEFYKDESYRGVVTSELEANYGTLNSGISIDEFFSYLSDWMSINIDGGLLYDEEFLSTLSGDVLQIVDLIKMKDTDIPDNKLKRSVRFSDAVTYGDMLKLAYSLLKFRQINISQYLNYQSSILKKRTNWDYLR